MLSHDHWDHMGGFHAFLGQNAAVTVYVLKVPLMDSNTASASSERRSSKRPTAVRVDHLGRLFVERTIPEHRRSGNGPDFAAEAVGKWLAAWEAAAGFSACSSRRAPALAAR